ncbi:MAG TPA: phosphatase PAP2 family protein [Vicinamibacterales bacterium]
MIDPLVTAVAAGILGSAVAGPVMASRLDVMPARSRRRAEWLLVAGALLLALIAARVPSLVWALAVLPGLVTYLAFRTVLASTFVSLLPAYFVIGHLTQSWPMHRPETALDRVVPLDPSWVFVYGSLYTVILLLPLFVIRDRTLFKRLLQAQLAVMIVSYLGFLLYPTIAPRVEGGTPATFAEWALQLVYALDQPYGCFPSLHVAYSFVSAFACFRVHRGIGIAAAAWAGLIALSTLFTKQHYAVDAIAGAALAGVTYPVFLRGYARDRVEERDRRLAPRRALGAVAVYVAMVVGFWLAYRA